jgi:hypothetical protein
MPPCRHSFWDRYAGFLDQQQTRLMEVCEIVASGTEILFGCEHGDRIAAKCRSKMKMKTHA